MSKIYKIEAAGHGGLFAMHTKDADFVQQWEGKDEKDLVEEVYDAYHDDSGLEHVYAPHSGSNFTLYEIKWEEGQEDEEIEIQNKLTVHGFMSREVYTTDSENGSVPVLVLYTAEKGVFGSWEFETDEFDPVKLTASIVETDFGEFIQDVYYEGKKLEYNGDYLDTTGKGYHARVAWINPDFHEKKSTFDNEELIKESWESHLENYG